MEGNLKRSNFYSCGRTDVVGDIERQIENKKMDVGVSDAKLNRAVQKKLTEQFEKLEELNAKCRVVMKEDNTQTEEWMDWVGRFAIFHHTLDMQLTAVA